MGRDAAIGAGAVGTGAATAHHHQQESAQRDNYAPETGRSFPLGGSSNTGSGSNYPSGQSGTYPAGGSTTAEPHSSNLANKADPRIDNDFDRSRNTGTSGYGSSYPSGQSGTYPAGGSTNAGPHSSNLANKADPRVDSDLDRSRNTGTSGYGSGASATPASTHSGRDAALGAGTGAAAGGMTSGLSSHGPESWRHDHGTHGHQYEGDPCGPGETSAGGPHFVSGPHATDTANRLDPHVSSGVGGSETRAGRHGEHSHRGEEAALAGGATAAGLSAHGTNRDHHSTTAGGSTDAGLSSSGANTGSSSTGPAPTTAGPHKSDMLNKMDPRVDSDLSKQQGSTSMPASGLGSSTTGTSDPYSSHDSGLRRGEGAALGGAGLAGATAYEGDRHRRNEPNISNTTSGTGLSTGQYPSSSVDSRVGAGQSGLDNATTTGSGRDHHLGRDAGLGAGAGGLAYEAERHHGQPTQSTSISSGTAGSGYDGTRGSSAYDHAGSRMAGSSQQPAATKDHHLGRDAALGAGAGGVAYEAAKHHEKDRSGVASTPQSQLAGSGHQPQAVGSRTDYPQQTGREHHLGRDAAIGGTALGAGAAGVDEHKKFQETGRMDPGTSVREHQHSGDPVATYPSSGYGNERSAQDPAHHGHRKEEEALAGGAAAGGLAHHEYSKKDEKALEKEHHKEVKQHEKELAKEEKAHEKERAKHMAAIEKDQKKHEHDVQKHEHDGEKKKGGLLGFLHRDKPDKELKEDEAHRQAALRSGGEETSAGAGAGSYSDPLAGEHGSQSGVHDTPMGKGITTHDAYGTQEGQNRLHKDPPGSLAGAHGADYQGHGNVS